MKTKLNVFFIGLITGILLPPITFLIIALVMREDLSLIDYWNKLVNLRILTKFLSLSVLPNLLLFFGFIWKDFLKSARGTLAATFIMAFLVLLIKLLV